MQVLLTFTMWIGFLGRAPTFSHIADRWLI